MSSIAKWMCKGIIAIEEVTEIEEWEKKMRTSCYNVTQLQCRPLRKNIGGPRFGVIHILRS